MIYALIAIFIIATILKYFYNNLDDFWNEESDYHKNEKAIEEEYDKIREEMMNEYYERQKVSCSFDRNDFIINESSYKRGNNIEREYRKKFKLYLLKVFGNKCANCGSDNNGLDIDHFIFPKNEGGNFIMINKKGHYMNNAIPLCESCNRMKSDNSVFKVFELKKLNEMIEKSNIVSERINLEGICSDK